MTFQTQSSDRLFCTKLKKLLEKSESEEVARPPYFHPPPPIFLKIAIVPDLAMDATETFNLEYLRPAGKVRKQVCGSGRFSGPRTNEYLEAEISLVNLHRQELSYPTRIFPGCHLRAQKNQFWGRKGNQIEKIKGVMP